MKKWLKVCIVIIFVVSFVGSSLLLYAANYLFELALNPNSDKTIFLEQEEVVSSQEVAANKYNIFDNSIEMTIISADGLQLNAYRVEQESDTWVFTIHGYTSQGNEMNWAAKRFYNMGYNILSPDLRSHGKSDGDYIAMGWDDRLDLLMWIDAIVEENENAQIILFGISMGAATVMNTIGEEIPDNVIMAIEDCGFTNAWDIFSYHLDQQLDFPTTPLLSSANLIARLRAGFSFKNGPIDQISNCDIPVLFIHGSKDGFVPSYMLNDLYEAKLGEKEMLIIEGAGHAKSNDVDATLYWETIETFIQKYR